MSRHTSGTRIARRLKAVDFEKQMVTAADIAEIMRLSVRHVRERVVKRPRFPRQATRARWFLSDVNKYIEQEAKRHGR